jgi:hypothetical protein
MEDAMNKVKSIMLAIVFGMMLMCAAASAQEKQQPPAGAPPAATPAAPGQPGMGQRGGMMGDRARQFQQRRMNNPGAGALGMNRPQRNPLEMFDSMDKGIQNIDKQIKSMKGGGASVYRRWFLILTFLGVVNALLLLLILLTLMKKNSGSV